MKYFISYVYYESGEQMFGNAEWEGASITSIEQIKSIEDEINQAVPDKTLFAKILYWKPFEE